MLKDNLARIRKARGYKTAKSFAEEIGLTYTTYADYEKGAWPSEKNLLLIADTLEVSIDELLGHAVSEYDKFAQLVRAVPGYNIGEEGSRVVVEREIDTVAGEPVTTKYDFASRADFCNYLRGAVANYENITRPVLLDAVEKALALYELKRDFPE